MRILDRYLMKEFLLALVYCLLFFLILFVIVDVFNNLDEFLRHGAPLRIILSYYLYLLPALVVQVVPVAALVALLYILGNLSRHNEILALKASGVSAFHILSPYLFTGILISFLIFVINETVVPRSTITSTAIMDGLIKEGRDNFDERAIKNVTLYSKANQMIFAREFEVTNQTLRDVVIFEGSPHQALKTKFTAKKAQYENGQWQFYDAMKYRTNLRGDLVGGPVFSEKLTLTMDVKPDDFIHEASQIDFMNIKQLSDYLRRLQGVSKKLIQKLSVDFHYKIAFPFVSFVVILIGSPLAMQTKRAGTLAGIGASLAVVLAYYGMDSICLALGKGGILPPFLSAWFTNFFFAGLGIYLIRNSS